MYPFINSKIDNNKPILIIGNSPSVKNIELGKYINSSNFNIIRFNLAKIEGYEKYVGSDTTYWVVNGKYWNTNKNKIDNKNRILIAELPHTKHFHTLCNDYNHNFKSIQIIPNHCRKYLRNYPTSGMLAIAFFLEHYPHIYIHGFTFDHRHYFELNNKGANHHSYSNEKKVVNKLINLGRIIMLDQDICLKNGFACNNNVN